MAPETIQHDPALISGCRRSVLEEWIDANGHMNVGYYAVVFDRATDVFLDEIRLGWSYMEETGNSTFTAEIHVSYLRELRLGAPLYFTSQLIGFDEKRIHYFHNMYHETEGYLAATNECLSLHVDLSTRKVTAMSDEALARLDALMSRQRHLPAPEQLGRVMKTKPRIQNR